MDRTHAHARAHVHAHAHVRDGREYEPDLASVCVYYYNIVHAAALVRVRSVCQRTLDPRAPELSSTRYYYYYNIPVVRSARHGTRTAASLFVHYC